MSVRNNVRYALTSLLRLLAFSDMVVVVAFAMYAFKSAYDEHRISSAGKCNYQCSAKGMLREEGNEREQILVDKDAQTLFEQAERIKRQRMRVLGEESQTSVEQSKYKERKKEFDNAFEHFAKFVNVLI